MKPQSRRRGVAVPSVAAAGRARIARQAPARIAAVPLHIQTDIRATRRGFKRTASMGEGTLARHLRPAAR